MDRVKLELKRVGDINGRFFIPSYQRGYRWGKKEVITLLQDIYETKGKVKYCLQPVVLRLLENSEYEVIDGQQRLTTLYIIYKFISSYESKYKISYETRYESEDFLDNITEYAYMEEKANSNIDFYFMAQAYRVVEEWFENSCIPVEEIKRYLDTNINIIWYEVGEKEDPIALFTRLNIGKIPLTSSELVKAMILSKNQNNKISVDMQREISLIWDSIEQELNHMPFWSFLTNRTPDEYQTKIDIILDLISGKSQNERDEYYTFFYFNKRYRNKGYEIQNAWEKIYQVYLQIKDWYEDHELYHKIGYLISSEYTTINELYKISENMKKSEFRYELDNEIRKSIDIPGNYAELSYNNQSQYEKIKRVLLLFNVETVRNLEQGSQWFPFDRFKFQKKGNRWSLEHIHAQESMGLRKESEWREWITLHLNSLKGIESSKSPNSSKSIDPSQGIKSLEKFGNTNNRETVEDLESSLNLESSIIIDRMEKALASKRITQEIFDSLYEDVTKLLSPKNSEYIHSIGNLALLNTGDNAALSNSTFDVKRNEIIKMDKEGRYIPVCTRMVFLKYYTESEKHNLHLWNYEDRKGYIKEINRVIGKYLNEEIEIEG